MSNTLPVNGDSLIFNLTQPGVLNLTSTNDLTGLTLGGTNAITFTNDAGTGTGFTLTGNSITLSGNITSTGTTGTHTHTLGLGLVLSGTRTVTSVAETTIAIDGAISETGGSFGFTKTGAGTVTLSATNSFTGALSANQGVLSVNSVADSGVNSAIGAGSAINIGSGTNTAGTLTYTGAAGSTNRTINLVATNTGGAVIQSSGTGALVFNGTFTNAGTGTKTLTLGGSNADSNEIQSVLGNGSGTLSVTKANGGTWVLSAVNTFTGNVSVNQGTLSVNSIADSAVNSAIGAGSSINFGSGAQTGTLLYTGATASTNRTIHLASAGAGGGVIDASGSGALTITGNVTNAATSGSKTLTLNGTTSGNEFQGVISDGGLGGVVAMTKGDTGTWTLTGLNTFTGALSVNRATLSVNTLANSGVNSAIGAGSVINLGSGNQGGTLTYTGTGASTNRTVNLASAAAGGGTLNSNGSGALVFTGTLINAGASGTKTLTLGGSYTGDNEFQSVISNGSAGGIVALTKSGASTWIVSASNSFTGDVTINQGVLSVNSMAASGADSAIGAGSAINFGSGTQTGTLLHTGAGVTLNRAINLATTGAGGGNITNNGTGALILNGTFTNAGTTGTKTFTLSGSNANVSQFQSVISDGVGGGFVAVTKSGTGTWALTAANTYTGNTTLNAGTLLIQNASAIGSGTFVIAGGAFDNTSGAAITLSTNNAVNINSDFTFGGTHGLNFGTGVVTIGNANRVITLNGGSKLSLGELQWNSVNAARTLTVNQGSGSGAKLVLGGFQLNINADTAAKNRTITGSAEIEISGVISNGNAFNNGLIYSGSSTLTLSGANTYTRGTTVSSGTLLVNNSTGSGTGTGGVQVDSSATLGGNGFIAPSSGNSIIINGILSIGGAGDVAGQDLSLTLAGAASLALNGTVRFDLLGNSNVGTLNALSAADVLDVNAPSWSNVSLGGLSTLKVSTALNSLSFIAGDAWRLLDWTDILSGAAPVQGVNGFATLDLPVLSPGLTWDTTQLFATGHISVAAVPEPTRALLVLMGIVALLLQRRRF